MGVKQRSVYIPDDLWHHLRVVALDRGVSASTVLDEAVAEWCYRNPLPVAVASPLREGNALRVDDEFVPLGTPRAAEVLSATNAVAEGSGPAQRGVKLTTDQILRRVNRGTKP